MKGLLDARKSSQGDTQAVVETQKQEGPCDIQGLATGAQRGFGSRAECPELLPLPQTRVRKAQKRIGIKTKAILPGRTSEMVVFTFGHRERQRPITQGEVTQFSNDLYPRLCTWESRWSGFVRKQGWKGSHASLSICCQLAGRKDTGRNRQIAVLSKRHLQQEGLVKWFSPKRLWVQWEKLADFFVILSSNVVASVVRARDFLKRQQLVPATTVFRSLCNPEGLSWRQALERFRGQHSLSD